MQRLRKIFYESLVSTSRFPRWWILALVQLTGLYLVAEFSRPRWLSTVFIFWLVAGLVLLVFSTTLLWLEIESAEQKQNKKIDIKSFIAKSQISAAIVIYSIILVIIVRFTHWTWELLTLISSMVAATATLGMLYAVLCSQPFYKALTLAFDTWNRKFSLAAAVAFVLIIAHGASFALVHGTLKNISNPQGFSVLTDSATIWILFLILLFLVAFIAAVLNNFLVRLFLQTIDRKKDPETEKAVLNKLVTSEASN